MGAGGGISSNNVTAGAGGGGEFIPEYPAGRSQPTLYTNYTDGNDLSAISPALLNGTTEHVLSTSDSIGAQFSPGTEYTFTAGTYTLIEVELDGAGGAGGNSGGGSNQQSGGAGGDGGTIKVQYYLEKGVQYKIKLGRPGTTSNSTGSSSAGNGGTDDLGEANTSSQVGGQGGELSYIKRDGNYYVAAGGGGGGAASYQWKSNAGGWTTPSIMHPAVAAKGGDGGCDALTAASGNGTGNGTGQNGRNTRYGVSTTNGLNPSYGSGEGGKTSTASKGSFDDTRGIGFDDLSGSASSGINGGNGGPWYFDTGGGGGGGSGWSGFQGEGGAVHGGGGGGAGGADLAGTIQTAQGGGGGGANGIDPDFVTLVTTAAGGGGAGGAYNSNGTNGSITIGRA